MKSTELIEDIELRPYFIEFISRIVALGFADSLEVNGIDRLGFERKYYEAFRELSLKLEPRSYGMDTGEIIEQVSQEYLNRVATIQELSVPSVAIRRNNISHT